MSRYTALLLLFSLFSVQLLSANDLTSPENEWDSDDTYMTVNLSLLGVGLVGVVIGSKLSNHWACCKGAEPSSNQKKIGAGMEISGAVLMVASLVMGVVRHYNWV